MPVLGYQCLVRKSGTTTAVVDEPCELVSGTTFRITASAKRCVDPDVSWFLEADAVAIPADDVLSADLVNGEFTLSGDVSPSAVITFSGSFLPLTTTAEVLTEAKSFSLGLSTELADTTVFTGTSNMHAGLRRRLATLKDVSLEVESIASHSDLFVLQNYKDNATRVVTEIYFGADGTERFRGYCFIDNIDRSGDVGDLISTAITFKIASTRDANGFLASYNFKAQP